MKCFNHHDRDAFGICKVCGKGLCLECLKDEKGIITCKNSDCLNRKNFWKILVMVLLFIALVLLIIDFVG